MPQDLFTLKKTAENLSSLLEGAKINKIAVPSIDEVVFTLYKNKTYTLVISTNANFARVSLTLKKYENPLTAPNFCMLLRKYVSGAEIEKITCDGVDRTISISLKNINDFKENQSFVIHAEIMGKYSNVFLTCENKILGALKQNGQHLDSKRSNVVGLPYEKVPPQNKVYYGDKNGVLNVFSNAPCPMTSTFIMNNFLGFAPVTCEEICYRINTTLKENFTKESLYNAFINFIQTPVSPVIIKSDKFSDVFLFDYVHLSGIRTNYSSLIDAISNYYDEKQFTNTLQSRKNALLQKVNAFEKKENKKLSNAIEKLSSAKNYEKFKLYGELLTANLHLIKGRANSIKVLNYYDQTLVEIPLDSTLSPSKNAQNYYVKYAKQKRAIEHLSLQISECEDKLYYVSGIRHYIQSAENNVDLDELEREISTEISLKNTAVKTKVKNKNQKVVNCVNYLIDGYTVMVGKNNLSNDALLQQAQKTDLWLHVKNYHSAFVIIKTEGKPVPDSVILKCAEICAYRSSASGGTKIPVDVTERKFVKKPPASKPGSVTYLNYKTYYVNPAPHKDCINEN